MSEVVYVSKSHIERKRGPLRIAHLPGEPQPVVYSVHGAIAEHYKTKHRQKATSCEIADVSRASCNLSAHRIPLV